MRLILPKKFFFIFLIVLFFSVEGFSQTYTITGNVNASSYSCSTFSGYNVISIGNGTTTTVLTINSGFDLSCLGQINFVVKNNATILFENGANDRITLAEGSTITINSGANIDGGNQCTASDRIYIGGLLVSTCNGQANSNSSFDDLESLGGTGSVNSNSPVCVGSSINLTATPPPNGTFTYSWTGPNSFTSTSQNPTFTATASSGGEYNVVMTRTSDSKKAYGRVAVTVNSLPTVAAIGGEATTVCVNTSTSAFTNTTSGGTWSITNGTGTASITTGGVVTGMTAGTVTVNYTISNGTCSNTVTKSLTVNALPSAGLTSSDADNTFCSGTSVTFTATGGTNYNFRVGGSSVQNSTSSTYTTTALTNGQVVDVIVTNASGCTATSLGITNTVNNLPSAGLTSSDTDNTFCTGTSVIFTATGGTNYNFRVGGSSVQNGTSSTYTTTVLTNGQVVDVIVTNASGCTATSSGITNTVNALPTAGLTSSDADNTFCSGTSVTFTATGGTNYDFRIGGSSVQNGAVSTYITTVLTNGQVVDVIVTNTSGCTTTSSGITNTVNSLPSTPTAGTPTNPTCTVPTGSVVLSNLPASGTITRTGSYSNDSYVITGGGSQLITDLLPGVYYFAVTNGSCTSNTVTVTIVAPETNTWSGSWSNGAPTINQRLVFASDYTNANDVDIEGCSCQVTGTTIVTIKSGRTLKIENGVEVQPNAKLIFENDASLVQMNDAAVNSGNINYKRHTGFVKRYDFTYWSSPVTSLVDPQTLKKLSPNTLFDKYYSYSPTSGWKIEYNGTAIMEKGRGYIIRAPQTFSITVPAVDTAPEFVGVPNNGLVSYEVPSSLVNLIGNPYPSAIDADKFIAANSTSLEGTLYFWTHNTSPSKDIAGDAIYNYTTNDYVTYNKTGGVNLATGKIAAGQSFFAPSTATGGTVVFNNAMRYTDGQSNYDNSQFYKLSSTSKTTAKATAETEKSRIWLNLTNKEGAYKQMLIGYIAGATNDYDRGFDGVSYDGNQYVDFYSVNQGTKLSIQGRAVPFVKQDSVALGYKSTIVGEFQISIDHTDGVLSSQNVFLEDKDLNILHDLKKGAYTFSTVKGTFKNRFVLRYVDKNAVEPEPVIETPQVDEVDKTIMVSVNNNEITVSSSEDLISKIIIYDVSGKIIYQKENVSANDFVIQNLLSSQQLLLVSLVLENGKTIATKVLY
ncbi:hypothetical protein GCM10008015_04310 [Flavobacterium palustre]|uniref:Ig-like domain-containing protein n=1 Tax=Flavobacterium palustre TaxID=1476463 RepID=A0ABQ1HAQ0_9FLAO|nr:T9SS sorting signal type C domain-containing protein [Flavobacterium palustre]GGA66760.1 hypothetical protein GCM10008015_04310 [Flavobacterium palustre]